MQSKAKGLHCRLKKTENVNGSRTRRFTSGKGIRTHCLNFPFSKFSLNWIQWIHQLEISKASTLLRRTIQLISRRKIFKFSNLQVCCLRKLNTLKRFKETQRFLKGWSSRLWAPNWEFKLTGKLEPVESSKLRPSEVTSRITGEVSWFCLETFKRNGSNSKSASEWEVQGKFRMFKMVSFNFESFKVQPSSLLPLFAAKGSNRN